MPPHSARMTFLGHAMTRIELPPGAVLTDPVLRRRVAFLQWVAPRPTLASLGALDAVLVSHLHHDHCDLPSLRQLLLGHDRPLVVPAGTDSFFRRRGFSHVVPLRPGESHRVHGLRITATPAAHHGRRRPVGPSTPLSVGYLVTGGGLQVYFAGDTGLFPQMRDLGPDLAAALLPVAGWGRGLGAGHLDPRTAADAVELLRPRVAVPIHWGALRPVWQRDAPQTTSQAASQFAEAVVASTAPTTPVVLEPGESIPLPAPVG